MTNTGANLNIVATTLKALLLGIKSNVAAIENIIASLEEKHSTTSVEPASSELTPKEEEIVVNYYTQLFEQLGDTANEQQQ